MAEARAPFREVSNVGAAVDPSAVKVTMEEEGRPFKIIVAATQNMGIGVDGKLPWRLPGDMAFFKKTTLDVTDATKHNAVVMGRKTWESIPAKFRPLPGRLNVVLTRNASYRTETNLPEEVLVESSLPRALSMLATPAHATKVESVFVIGGGQIYTEALRSPLCKTVHLTRVHADVACDTTFPLMDAGTFSRTKAFGTTEEKGFKYRFEQFDRLSDDLDDDATESAPKKVCAPVHEELQYLDLVRDIISTGTVKGDRTGTGTVSKFGAQMRFSLRDGQFPLLTTKRVFWRGVAEELLWFVRGSTSAKLLQDKNVRIWDGNASREFLDSVGLGHREVGDLGPVYGFQWRHFGAKYVDMHTDYTGQGVDQLANLVHTIKTNPNDRRMILSAWNPGAIKEMALPPCHMFAQFYVCNGELSCQMYQRSGDVGLGVPFNIASYSLLTVMLAKVCGLVPGEFVHVIGDAHVYSNHVEPLKEQITREPRAFPTLKITRDVKDIDDFQFEDFLVEGYSPHKAIKMEMAV